MKFTGEIKQAKEADVETVVRMVHEYLAAAPYSAMFPPAPGRVTRVVQQMMRAGSTFWVARDSDKDSERREMGLTAVVIFEHPFTAELTAEVAIWYVRPEFRSKGVGHNLLRVAVDRATKAGASVLKIPTPFGSPAGVVLEAHGFIALEQSHFKVLRHAMPIGKPS